MLSTAGQWNTTANFAFADRTLAAANAFSSDPDMFNAGNKSIGFSAARVPSID